MHWLLLEDETPCEVSYIFVSQGRNSFVPTPSREIHKTWSYKLLYRFSMTK